MAESYRLARWVNYVRVAIAIMVGYWNDEERTRQSIDAGRWMHTGDLAVMDEEGYVNIVGRIKDMLIRGWRKRLPRGEIEEFLYSHPKVSDVQVIGVPRQEVWRGSDGLGKAARRRDSDDR